MTLADMQDAGQAIQQAWTACENDVRAGRCRSASVRELVRATIRYNATRAAVRAGAR
jgi:hypothetical protein